MRGLSWNISFFICVDDHCRPKHASFPRVSSVAFVVYGSMILSDFFTHIHEHTFPTAKVRVQYWGCHSLGSNDSDGRHTDTELYLDYIPNDRALSPTLLLLHSACRHFPAESGMLLPFFMPVCVSIVDTTQVDIHPEIITYCPSILCTLGSP